MVSTRSRSQVSGGDPAALEEDAVSRRTRSGSRASQDDPQTPGAGSQPATGRRTRQQRAVGRSVLSPVVEQPAERAGGSQASLRSGSRAQPPRRVSDSDPSDDQGAGTDDDNDDAAVDAMAAAMRAALAARTAPQPDAASPSASASSDGASSSDDEDDNAAEPALRWRPTLTGLDGPTRRAYAAHAADAHNAALVANARKDPALAKQLTAGPLDPRREERLARRRAGATTAGAKWFDLPATQIDEEAKRELRLLRLRGAMDPKRFYRSMDATKFPTYFQVGRVVEGAADFYSGRLTKAQRKRTLAEEVLADTDVRRYRKRRYAAMQAEAIKWSQKRRKKGKKELPRLTPKPHRPKH
ncbi:unnamed protein product [Pedinophyceae sp. YPF-701]|nr:unnamed protein product [Pedinophyceae sp. YPF-701]